MASESDSKALDVAYSLAYEELRKLAGAILRGDRAATISPTALVNEVWLKFCRSPQLAATSPLHFRRIAGRAMRQILVDAARRRQAEMHGGGLLKVAFDDSLSVSAPSQELEDLLTLNNALLALSKLSPRQAVLVEGRFFGGLSWAESAEALGISEATVMREWRSARAWLASQLRHRCLPDASHAISPMKA